MRTPQQLAHHELAAIVDALQQSLYLDFDHQTAPIWNPDKEWNGGDICNQMAAVLAEFELIPLVAIAVADGAPSNTVSPE